MKRLMIFAVMFLTLCISVMAADIRIAWNAMPTGQAWTAVRAYENVAGVYTKVGETSVVNGPLTITGVGIGLHTYVLRSYNGQQESGNSAAMTVTILVAPVAPTGGTITIIVLAGG